MHMLNHTTVWTVTVEEHWDPAGHLVDFNTSGQLLILYYWSAAIFSGERKFTTFIPPTVHHTTTQHHDRSLHSLLKSSITATQVSETRVKHRAVTAWTPGVLESSATQLAEAL